MQVFVPSFLFGGRLPKKKIFLSQTADPVSWHFVPIIYLIYNEGRIHTNISFLFNGSFQMEKCSALHQCAYSSGEICSVIYTRSPHVLEMMQVLSFLP